MLSTEPLLCCSGRASSIPYGMRAPCSSRHMNQAPVHQMVFGPAN